MTQHKNYHQSELREDLIDEAEVLRGNGQLADRHLEAFREQPTNNRLIVIAAACPTGT